MERTFIAIFRAASVVLVILGFMRCTKPVAHRNHSNGIAYYQYDTTTSPYKLKEVDSADMPFILHAEPKDPCIAGHLITLKIDNNGHVQFFLDTLSDRKYNYSENITTGLSNDLFFLTIDTNSVKHRKGDIYIFEFLKLSVAEQAKIYPQHPNGIGYYTVVNQAPHDLDITDSSLFKVIVEKRTDEILNVPIYINLFPKTHGHSAFYYVIGNHGYLDKSLRGFNEFDKITVTPSLSFKLQLSPNFKDTDANVRHYFKIER